MTGSGGSFRSGKRSPRGGNRRLRRHNKPLTAKQVAHRKRVRDRLIDRFLR